MQKTSASHNRGNTTLRGRKRGTPMGEYDRLPKELREWMASAKLPWRAGSVLKTYKKAYARTGRKDAALAELDRVQERLIAKDAAAIWGQAHPEAR